MSTRAFLTMALLLLPSMLPAAEPAPGEAPPVTQNESSDSGTRPLAQAFDLRGGAARNVIRTTAATQSNTDFRVAPAARLKPDLAAALKVEHPVPRPEPLPRLPQRPQPCNGFWSCGLETLLGLPDHDFEDEQAYARQERHRLMNQGSFTDKSGCEACSSPMDPNLKLRDPDGQGAPIRP